MLRHPLFLGWIWGQQSQMWLAAVILLIALLVGGCHGISLPAPAQPAPTMCHAPGGGYVPCNFGYHGSQGP
jgi:hypothetical protein